MAKLIKKKIISKNSGKVSRGKVKSRSLSKELNANREDMQIIGEENSQKEFAYGYHLVTSINIDTKIHEKLLSNMKAYQKWIEKKTKLPCTIHVMMTFYQTNDPIYSNRISPNIPREYLRDGRCIINREVELVTDMDIRPTTINPLGGLQRVGSTNVLIVPSPRRHDKMTSAATPDEQRHLLTSLSLGEPKYQRGKQGGLANEHHFNGFVVVEPHKDGEWMCPRQVTCDSKGNFTDVTVRVSHATVLKGVQVPEAYIFGDLHGIEANVKAIKKRRPLYEMAKYVLSHDTFSFSNMLNHHEAMKPLDQRSRLTITEEIEQTKKIIKDLFGKISHKTYFVDSNHDDSFSRWLNFFNIKDIPTVEDRRLYLEASLWRIDNPKRSIMDFLFPGYNQATPKKGFDVKGIH